MPHEITGEDKSKRGNISEWRRASQSGVGHIETGLGYVGTARVKLDGSGVSRITVGSVGAGLGNSYRGDTS